MISSRGIGPSKVNGHADEDLVRQGQVREPDRDGNNRADDAADFGRRRVGPDVIDARCHLPGVCVGGGTLLYKSCIGSSLLSLVLLSMLIVLLVLLLTPSVLCWNPPKRRKVVHAIRDAALLPPLISHSINDVKKSLASIHIS